MAGANFSDRNGQSLTDETKPSLILFPFLKHIHFDLDELARILQVDPEILQRAIDDSVEPFVFGDPNPSN